MKTFPTIAAVIFCLVACAASGQSPVSIVNSKHNLSVSGRGDVHATTEKDVCIFCHTPHQASTEGPLWNHAMSTATYTPYNSSTLNATVGQPTGASKLCLSCHDGTIALGIVNSRRMPIQMQGGNTMPAGPNNMGTDLSADHPVSFRYDADLVQQDSQLNDPATLVAEVQLDRNQEMQCTSCHDPHNNQFGSFLVKDNTGSALCLDCHKLPLWPQSPHAVSSLVMTPVASPSAAAKAQTGGTKPVTVSAAGCANCHTSHFAGNKKRLMKLAGVEQNCLSCHDGKNSALKNIAADFKKISAHPITLNGDTHDAREDVINPATRHVTCADCHNPHATPANAGHALSAAAPLVGVAGVTAAGGTVPAVTREYELCFRCHADSANRGPARVNRQLTETNKRFQFNPANQSFHPVESSGRNPNVPSLVTPWTVASLVTCTDCHNSDQSPAGGGAGANGPHGSVFAPLLERQQLLNDYIPESSGSYALCYKCHSRESILGDQSFRAVNASGQGRGHRFHIADQKTACTTCHDSHGVASNARLINFNTDYVTPASNGQIRFTAGTGGPSSGNCTLTCHGKDHIETSYPTPTPSLLKLRRR